MVPAGHVHTIARTVVWTFWSCSRRPPAPPVRNAAAAPPDVVASTEEVTGMELIAEVWVPDCVALDEIELYGELIIAASASERPLTRSEIDAVLGIGV